MTRARHKRPCPNFRFIDFIAIFPKTRFFKGAQGGFWSKIINFKIIKKFDRHFRTFSPKFSLHDYGYCLLMVLMMPFTELYSHSSPCYFVVGFFPSAENKNSKNYCPLFAMYRNFLEINVIKTIIGIHIDLEFVVFGLVDSEIIIGFLLISWIKVWGFLYFTGLLFLFGFFIRKSLMEFLFFS